jgi:lipoate-protein ligase A
MALDEALLLSAERDGIAWLRFYTWCEPTLSLGYFQSHADRQLHAASTSCKLVRRASGGGAILHDRELTYSIALPANHRLARRAELLYGAAHRSLIETLGDWKIPAALHVNERPLVELAAMGGTGKRSLPVLKRAEPFLCFQRRTPGDVLLGEHKIGGSAQRRHRGAVLQHGSVLLAKSEFAPELPGVFDLAKNPAQKQGEIRVAWQPRLAERLGVRFEEAAPSNEIVTAAKQICEQKFAAQQWTWRR